MQDLVTSIEVKYGDTGEEEPMEGSCMIYVPKSKMKSSHSDCCQNVPARLTMEDYNISTVGDTFRLRELCQSVHELDLTKNCINDWKQVISILENVPRLNFLNLTRNPLVDTTCPDADMTFPYLFNLVLNSTGVSWQTVAKILHWFSGLTELHLSLMDYTCIELPENFVHASLKSLYINECNICDWAEISKLGHAFPYLEYLNLVKINIKNLGDTNQYDEFSSLRSLNISGTELASWTEIDKFRLFPSLAHIRLTDLTLLKNWDPKERRQHIIARLPNISMLNGSPVSNSEREDAERAFIRYFMDREQNQRYHELTAVYGKLDPLVELDLAPRLMIEVRVKHQNKEEVLQVDSYMTTAELKKLLRNLAGVPPSKFHLYINRIFQGEFLSSDLIRPLDKKLYRLNIEPEDMFEIVLK